MRDRIAVAVTASSSSAFEAARDVVAIAVGKDSALLATTTPRKSVMNYGTDKRRRSDCVVSPAAGPIQSDARIAELARAIIVRVRSCSQRAIVRTRQTTACLVRQGDCRTRLAPRSNDDAILAMAKSLKEGGVIG